MSNQVTNKIIRVRLNDGAQVNGQVNISGYDRLSDLIMDNSNDFLVLTNATAYLMGLDNPVKHETMFLGRRYIAWAVPESEEL